MMPRARAAVLSFGLVSIPVEIYPAIKNESVTFNWLHAKCGSRIRNRMVCPVCNETVEWANLLRGYEVSKNQYVSFMEAELKSLETEGNKSIELKEFLPLSKVDPVGAREGGEIWCRTPCSM